MTQPSDKMTEEFVTDFRKLNETDRQILKMRIRFPQMSASKIAKQIGMSGAWVRKRLKQPLMEKLLDDLAKSESTIIKIFYKEAILKLFDLMETAQSEVVQQKCAKDLATLGMSVIQQNKEDDSARDFYEEFNEKTK